MKNPLYIVSDNHFSMDENNQNEKERRDKLFKVFKKIENSKKGTVIIGGDFFDYWFDYTHVIPSGYQTILNALKSLSQSGIKIHYILGNHDYWDFGFLNKELDIIVHKKNLEINFNNQKLLFTHGDGLLQRDYGYRFMKSIIRHPLFIKLYKLFPPDFTCKLAKKISKSSSLYNHHDKYVDIIKHDVFKYAKKKWEQGVDTVFVGHYHQVGIYNTNNKKVIFLGDWLSKYTVTVVDENKYWQGDWKKFLDLS